MNWAGFFTLIHVVLAIVWVGGGFTMLLAAETMRRKRGSGEMMVIVDAVALLGPKYFVPVSFFTLVSGVIAVWLSFSFSELWVILGLIGYAATFLNGLLMIKPRSEKMSAMTGEESVDHPEVVEAANTLMKIARFDYVMLLLVIADMVLQPKAEDTLVLVAMAVVLGVGGWLTIGQANRSVSAA